MPTTTISTRVDEAEATLIESLANDRGCDRSTFVKMILRRGIRELRLEQAVEAYAAEKATLSRAAEIAGISIWDFMALMPEKNLVHHYDVKEFEEDLESFRKLAEKE